MNGVRLNEYDSMLAIQSLPQTVNLGWQDRSIWLLVFRLSSIDRLSFCGCSGLSKPASDVPTFCTILFKLVLQRKI